MERRSFHSRGLQLSYWDAGGRGQPLIALHAHFMEGQTYGALALALAPDWRVIAPDQRGHGYSDHAPTYTREDYLSDLDALYQAADIETAVLLGNSLGGVNAYQFAARHPERVRALIIEDIGAVIADDTSFALAWSGSFEKREDLAERLGPHLLPYMEPFFRRTPKGWRLAFDPEDMVKSQASLNGDHWQDWLASSCPALLIRGADSRVSSQSVLEEMASRRSNTQLRVIPGGHVVHVDNPQEFNAIVREFLTKIKADM